MSIKPEYLAPYGEDLELHEDGSLNVEYYRAKAEALRADFLKGLFKSLFSSFKKRTADVEFGNPSAPHANIVCSQKLTFSI